MSNADGSLGYCKHCGKRVRMTRYATLPNELTHIDTSTYDGASNTYCGDGRGYTKAELN